MTLGSHQRTIGKSQNHITPKWIIDALGPFDLDPCAADPRPWHCALHAFTEYENGLEAPWFGFVWLNPPFDRRTVHLWVTKLAKHNNGIALLHARTETAWFRPCWQHASAFLFLSQRIVFYKPDGSQQTTKDGFVANSGAPPVFVGFGDEAFKRLLNSRIPGAFVSKWSWCNAL